MRCAHGPFVLWVFWYSAKPSNNLKYAHVSLESPIGTVPGRHGFCATLASIVLELLVRVAQKALSSLLPVMFKSFKNKC